VNGPEATHDVLVLTGTDHHQFRRLVDWVEAWVAVNPSRSVLVQHGYTAAPGGATRADYAAFLEHAHIGAHLAVAAAVVCHGGPGTIVDCRLAGLMPVVVPRSADLGEHVDNHQQRYTARLHEQGVIDRADSYERFGEAMAAALDRERANLATLDDDVVSETVTAFGDQVSAALERRRVRRGSGRMQWSRGVGRR
jgi:UDP-N-acetylglucosamine transferase subunit ALG13